MQETPWEGAGGAAGEAAEGTGTGLGSGGASGGGEDKLYEDDGQDVVPPDVASVFPVMFDVPSDAVPAAAVDGSSLGPVDPSSSPRPTSCPSSS